MSSPSEPPLSTSPKPEQREPDYSAGDLADHELFWQDHCQWFKEKGYILPARYQPGWIPSWRGTDRNPIACYDGKFYPRDNVMDATRVSDGTLVMLKIVDDKRYPHEIEIAQSFASDQSDKRNHCVPVLDVFTIPEEEKKRIMVTPFLHLVNEPDFDTIGEAVDYCGQIIEGLAYIHNKGAYHGDAKLDNILMDASHLFLTSFYPHNTFQTADCSGWSKTTYRTEKPVKYYFIDYGLSKIVKPGENPRRRGPWGGDHSVPEYHAQPDGLHDPFAVDVYCLGNVMREVLVDGNHRKLIFVGKKGFSFLKPLLDDMCHANPEKRPKMDEVVERFAHIRSSLSDRTLRSRAIDNDEKFIAGIIRSIKHRKRRKSYIHRGIPAIPSALPPM